MCLHCVPHGCPCGKFGSEQECLCSPAQIRRYVSRISGPLLDRIDIQVEVPAIRYVELSSEREEEGSELIWERVKEAREKQWERFKNIKIYNNAQMTSRHMKKHCAITGSSRDLLKNAIDKLGLSVRAHDRIIKVARTIADLDGQKDIQPDHIGEAIQYRRLDRKEQYWG